MNRLRVLTLNCWNVSAPFAERMALVRAGIQTLQPDIIGLQEIVVRRDGFDQGALILDDLGYHWVYGAAFRWDERGMVLPFDQDGDAFGNLIASRWPIRRHAIRELPGADSSERRTIIGALLAAPSGNVAFANTHLNWKLHHGHIRERQVMAVADFVHELARDASLPPILVGDMNADPDAAEIRFLCGLQSLNECSTYFQDAWRVAGDGGGGFTWDNRNRFALYEGDPNRRIDYIFVGKADMNLRGWIDSVRVVMNESRNEVFPSDHFGVLAEVRA